MIGLEEQVGLFKLIGTELKKHTKCVVIGGSAMLFYGLKTATKDVDIVFMKEEDMMSFKRTLKKIGFEESGLRIEKKYEGLARKKPILMKRKDMRFDLFVREVFSFKISEGIIERVKEIHEFGKLIVQVISPEDIILLKCATDRVGDREDAKKLIERFDVNWDIIIKESLWQTEHGAKIFPVFLYDFLLELKEMHADIPKNVIASLRKIAEEEMLKALKKR